MKINGTHIQDSNNSLLTRMRNINQEKGILAPIIPATNADLAWKPFKNSMFVFMLRLIESTL